jgi:hypothetical protein
MSFFPMAVPISLDLSNFHIFKPRTTCRCEDHIHNTEFKY